MELESLRALYVDELKDLYNAEGQILKAMPRMIKAASNRQLKQALTEHERVTRKQVQRLERIFKDLDETPRGKKCHGMEGLLKEGKELIAEKPEPEVLDAGLISKAQHVEHYEIAGYGTVRSWAQQLGFDQHVELLQETLDEEAEADKRLSALAESSINIEADESDEESSSDRDVAGDGLTRPAHANVGASRAQRGWCDVGACSRSFCRWLTCLEVSRRRDHLTRGRGMHLDRSPLPGRRDAPRTGVIFARPVGGF